jgi:hypothetical protein
MRVVRLTNASFSVNRRRPLLLKRAASSVMSCASLLGVAGAALVGHKLKMNVPARGRVTSMNWFVFGIPRLLLTALLIASILSPTGASRVLSAL